MVLLVHSKVESIGYKLDGEVCPGEWIYHYYDVPAAENGVDLEWHIHKFYGDFDALSRHSFAPLKLQAPFTHAGTSHILEGAK